MHPRDADLIAVIAQLHEEISQLRCEVSGLRCEVGSWKSRQADGLTENEELEGERNQARAEIKNLKTDLLGWKSEKQTSHDRSNPLEDPQDQEGKKKKKRGQQPGGPAPQRRDYSHLPVREETVDVPNEAKVCSCCGKPLADLGFSEDGEQLEIEINVYRRKVRRKRYRRTCHCQRQPRTVTAPRTTATAGAEPGSEHDRRWTETH